MDPPDVAWCIRQLSLPPGNKRANFRARARRKPLKSVSCKPRGLAHRNPGGRYVP